MFVYLFFNPCCAKPLNPPYNMTLIKDLNELDLRFRAAIIGVALTMPFWFLDIFIFENKLIINYAIYIPVVLSFCIAVNAFLMSIISLSIFTGAVYDEIDEGKKDMTFIMSFLFIIAWNSLVTVICYLNNCNFKQFLATYFIIAFVKIILSSILKALNSKGKQLSK